ncbi:MAG: hypothetical protein M3N68_03625 [Actinomycetota bacterium]|nr:hypothetical protein [Actinomycetota bacterium]
MMCPSCSGSRLVQIELVVDQRRVTMRSCSRCDTRWWQSDGKTIALPSVLDRAGNRA